MNNPSKLIQLSRISTGLDSIIKFDDQDDNQKKFPWLKTGATVGVGAGGVLAHQAIQRTGGYGANIMAMRHGPDLLGQATGNVAQGAGSIGAKLAPAYSAGKDVLGAGAAAGKSAWQSILAKLARPAAQALESKGKAIELDASILGPWHGPSGHTSKIDQLEFPAGLSPAAALKFPLPKLMRYMNQRNIMQQKFSQKHKRLIELNSKLDEIQFREDRSGKTWKGAAVAGGVGLAGYGAYKGVQELQPVKRHSAGTESMTKVLHRVFPARGASELEEKIGEQPFRGTMKLSGRMAKAYYKGARHAKLSAKLDNILYG